jgi:sirohydrochlorin cobaltochelatase
MSNQNPNARGVILFAHGSRDPLWRLPIEAVAARVAQVDATVHVQCAYLELMAPDLAHSVAQQAAAGVRQITVVPMFLGVGKHAREDLPTLMDDIRASYPAIRFNLQPAVGEQAEMIELMAKLALMI